MPRVLLTWELGGGAGHCVNLAPIAAGLGAQGWEVWLAVRDLATARRVLRSESIRYVQAPCLFGKAADSIEFPRTFAHILHNVGFADDLLLEGLVSAWRNLFDLVQPDVLVFDHAPTALLASRWRDVRRVVVGTGFFPPPDVAPLPDLPYWLPLPTTMVHCEEAILERVNRMLKRDGRTQLERLAQLYAQVDANFLLTFRELDHYTQREGASYWGMWSLPGGKSPEWPEGSGSRLFAYLKPATASWKLDSLLALLQEVNLPTLVYVGETGAARLHKFAGPRLRFLTEPVDIGQVAECCDVAVLNGNACTSTALLLKGVAQLLVPLYLEQAVYSRRVVELGAGFEAASNRPEQMSARLLAMIYGGHCRDAARQFAKKYSDYDPRQSIDEILSRLTALA